MNLKRRRLPHLYVIGQPLFVTFRLYGSLPANRPFPSSNLTSGEAFVTMDRLLDQARSGPTFLKQPAIAQLILASLECGARLGHYQMHSFVIMPNHVHLLLTPHVSVSKLLGSLKASTARRANLLLQRCGQPFWQDESYDHVVRSGDEFRRIQRYIENNPVTAGLAATAEQYAWSSAGRPARPPQAEGLPHTSPTGTPEASCQSLPGSGRLGRAGTSPLRTTSPACPRTVRAKSSESRHRGCWRRPDQ